MDINNEVAPPYSEEEVSYYLAQEDEWEEMRKDEQDLLRYQDEINEILSSMDYNNSIEMNTTEETEQSV